MRRQDEAFLTVGGASTKTFDRIARLSSLT